MEEEQSEQENLNPNNEISIATNDKIEYGKRHEWKRLMLIIVTNIFFLLTLIFNYLTMRLKLTPNSVGNISALYFTDITPAGWAFSIWGIIYIWQAVWLCYSFSCIFRRSKNGYYLYIRPDFFHFGIFVAMIANFISNIAWIFLWCNSHLLWSLLVIISIMVTLYIALIISLRKVKENEQLLNDEELKRDIWLNVCLVQNGLAFYATWISIASNLNFAVVLIWCLNVNIANAGTIALILILSTIILYFILENFVFPRYLLNLFSPWLVIIWALSGSISKNWQSGNPTRNNIITLSLLVIVSVLFVLRIVLFLLYKTILKHKLSRQRRAI